MATATASSKKLLAPIIPCLSRHRVGQPPPPRPAVGQKEYADRLHDERNGYQRDMQRIRQNGFALKREENDKRQQQSDNRHVVELFYKNIFKIRFAAALYDRNTREDPRRQRNHHEQQDRQQQRFHRHGDASDTEQ